MKPNQKIIEIMNPEQHTPDTFEDIAILAVNCKFTNCTHNTEPSCAVKAAIKDGDLDSERLLAYQRDKNEAAYVVKQKNKTKAIDYMKQRKLFHKPEKE
ncbi:MULTISPECIES: hypothetical protein [Rossellomorea]|uniref:hypothetical protein n=1 Tax=Rossellomorea TaxID=2837508 RepID=UPI001CFF084A|nr:MULTISPECIES: hypothetical protein [Rossellomorea]MDX8343551.1 hypothetical protein [Rossellomorea sp. YZS02]